MNQECHYRIIQQEDDIVMLQDECEIYGGPSITNAAEQVIESLANSGDIGPGVRVLYQDTNGDIDELIHDGDKFLDFKILSKRG